MVRKGSGTGPVGGFPDEDALDAELPALPGPEAEGRTGMIDEQAQVGGARRGAEVPPNLLTGGATCGYFLGGPFWGEGAPDVHVTEEFGLRLLGEHAAQAGSSGADALHALDDEFVVFRLRLVEPVSVSMVEPPACAQVAFELAQIVLEQSCMLGGAFGVSVELSGMSAVKGASSHAVQGEKERVECARIQPAPRCGVEGVERKDSATLCGRAFEAELDFRTVVERVRADPVFGEVLQVKFVDACQVGGVGKSVVAGDEVRVESKGTAQAGWSGQAEVIDLDLEGYLDGALVKAEGELAFPETGRGPIRRMKGEPQGLVAVGRQG